MSSGGPQEGESSIASGPDDSWSPSSDPHVITLTSTSPLAVGGSRGATSIVIGIEPLVKGG